jgi:hypothetical protein
MGSPDFGSADFESPDFDSEDFSAAGLALASPAGLADWPRWANAGRANSMSAITKLARVILKWISFSFENSLPMSS